MSEQFWYLATPYTKFPGGIEFAFEAACKQAAVLIAAGVPTFSPIAHSHPIAVYGNLDPLDLEMWLTADRPFMAAAQGCIMCRLPTWQVSAGMEHERQFFADRGLPVYYMDPGVVPLALRVDARQAEYAASRRAWRGSIPVAS